jgi:excisionase family DNA binding protein
MALMTQKEVCEELQVSTKTLQKWRREGKLKFYQFGYRTVRFSDSEIRKLKEANQKSQ